MSQLLDLPDKLMRRFRRGTVPRMSVVRLTRERIYILPTASGLLFALAVALMLLGSINFGLGLGFALTFLLTGVGMAAMLLTYRNLAGLQIQAYDAPAQFCGMPAVFMIDLRNESSATRTAIEIAGHHPDQVTTPHRYVDVPAGMANQSAALVMTRARGTLQLPSLRITTTFPLGLFRAWSNLELSARCIVYPCPEHPPAILSDGLDTYEQTAGRAGGEDFTGLRGYVAGDSPARIAWSALARGAGLATKQFDSGPAQQTWVRWSAIPPGIPTEQALMRLTRWVIDLSRRDLPFGFDIPGYRRPPDVGAGHTHACLRALAFYGEKL